MAGKRPPVLALSLGGAGAVAVAVSLALFRPVDFPPAAGSGPRPDAASDPPSVRSAGETPPPDAPPHAATSADAPSLDTLRLVCPDPWTEGVSDDCKAALAGRYRSEGMRTAVLHDDGLFWEPQSDPLPAEIAWAEAFADPVGARRAVSEALRDPACLAFADLPGMRVAARFPPFELYPRDDDPVPEGLRGACASVEAAKLAMLHEGCVVMLRSAGRGPPSPGPESSEDVAARMSLRERDTAFHHEELWGLHVEDLDADPTLTPEEYWRRREQIDDERFRFAWRRLMCHAADQSAFAMFDALPDAGHDLHQGKYLRWYAARFGNEWAQAVVPERYSAR
ncbi:MAG: hypothetical protein OXQ90_17085 [Gammaproteobacteria bacterium]|nr:hypothetical protein [Gammaproteobacteria bacterium]